MRRSSKITDGTLLTLTGSGKGDLWAEELETEEEEKKEEREEGKRGRNVEILKNHNKIKDS